MYEIWIWYQECINFDKLKGKGEGQELELRRLFSIVDEKLKVKEELDSNTMQPYKCVEIEAIRNGLSDLGYSSDYMSVGLNQRFIIESLDNKNPVIVIGSNQPQNDAIRYCWIIDGYTVGGSDTEYKIMYPGGYPEDIGGLFIEYYQDYSSSYSPLYMHHRWGKDSRYDGYYESYRSFPESLDYIINNRIITNIQPNK